MLQDTYALKKSKNMRPQDILAFNSAKKPSFQNPTNGFINHLFKAALLAKLQA